MPDVGRPRVAFKFEQDATEARRRGDDGMDRLNVWLGGDDSLDDDEDALSVMVPVGQRIWIRYDYPLTHAVTIEHPGREAGWTLADLVRQVQADYRHIYTVEAETVRDRPVIPPAERGACLNRNRTDGEYGIWGHDLEDLYLVGMTIDRQTWEVYLSVDS